MYHYHMETCHGVKATSSDITHTQKKHATVILCVNEYKLRATKVLRIFTDLCVLRHRCVGVRIFLPKKIT